MHSFIMYSDLYFYTSQRSGGDIWLAYYNLENQIWEKYGCLLSAKVLKGSWYYAVKLLVVKVFTVCTQFHLSLGINWYKWNRLF